MTLQKPWIASLALMATFGAGLGVGMHLGSEAPAAPAVQTPPSAAPEQPATLPAAKLTPAQPLPPRETPASTVEAPAELTPEAEAPAAEVLERNDQANADPDETYAERLARFKAEHPEAYERMMARREERLKAYQETVRKRQDFLSTVDETLLTEEQRVDHRRYLDALTARDAAREQIRQARELDEDPPPEALGALREAEAVIGEQAQSERLILMEAVARSMGFEEQTTQEFVQVMSTILETTEERSARTRTGLRGAARTRRPAP